MTSVFNSAIEGMADSLKAVAGTAVTYYRGSSSVSVTAVVGTTDVILSDDYGVQIDIQNRDYLITASELILDEALIEPQENDEIKETRNGVVYTYAVINIGGEGCFRTYDTNGYTLRIHTKLIDSETA